ncbi:hypothetical protein L6164_005866 [Bauhinia variegata]|uniref:Uncharacterized protein n=1 Tax=Bauhinia variegata TaxID=167791 RepID=A0ACB9PXZ2_BAUVA|nr:hypothetical protein L6164_005866 [Bauhinia variegata]
MSRSTLFGSGLELANFVAGSGLLDRSWAAISDLYARISANELLSSFSIKHQVIQESKLTIIVFVTASVCTQHNLQENLVSSSALKEDFQFPHFEFLCSKAYKSFSINRTAIELLCSQRDQLSLLKSQIDSSKPLIVTGHALGGSIASLFTLWLLDSIGLGKKLPLCITFGSPLIGDKNLQQAIARSSVWNSCFLHMASHDDPVPRLWISSHSPETSVYKPFGTFLLCSDKGFACFENPESILKLLLVLGSLSHTTQVQNDHYGIIVEDLKHKAISKEFIACTENMTYSTPLQSNIIMQLLTLGFAQLQEEQFLGLVKSMELQENTLCKKKKFDPFKKLNDMKIRMAYLEWYKKEGKTRRMGYYDSYKKAYLQSDHDVVLYKKDLTLYWKKMVEEVQMKPQKEEAAFRTRWLFAGTNYRRMVEPLDIADHYNSKGKDYQSHRSEHYIQLEKWLEENKTTSDHPKKQNVESILTFESCFWARVEEALLLLSSAESSGAEKEEARLELFKFEEYVFGLLKNYEVSPEIFLEESSFMDWWNKHNIIMGASHDSTLANFMRNPDNYKRYCKGELHFH